MTERSFNKPGRQRAVDRGDQQSADDGVRYVKLTRQDGTVRRAKAIDLGAKKGHPAFRAAGRSGR